MILLALLLSASFTADTRARVLDGAAAKLQKFAMDKDAASATIRDLQAHRAELLKIDDPDKFAEAVTARMRAASRDKHWGVNHLDHDIPDFEPPSGTLPPEMIARFEERARKNMYGIARLERLPGNIGLLKLDAMNFAEVAGGAMVHALRVLADTDALILDLRENGGGDPMMAALIVGFLQRGDRIIQEIRYGYRPADQFRTPSFAPAGSYGDQKPVYVLTSSETISAGEALPYALQGLKRATIVGETTAGAANAAVGLRAGDDRFSVALTMGRTVSAFGGGSWEGTGVKPDVAVAAAHALETAHVAALKKLQPTATGALRAEIDEALAKAHAVN